MTRRETWAYVGLMTVVLVWGTNFTVIKASLEVLHPLVFNALRFVLAGAILFAVLRARGVLSLPERADVPAVIGLGLIGNTGYQLTFVYGLDATLAGNGAIILASAPVWTVVLAVTFWGEEGTSSIWLATLVGAVGILLVILGGNRDMALGGEQLRGDLLVAASAVCWALYTVAGRRLVDRYGALQVTSWALWIGGAPLVLAGIPPGLTTDWASLTAEAWGGVVFASAGAIAAAYVLWYRAVGILGSPRTALGSNLVPVVALFVAWLWLSEVPGPLQLLGTACTLVSVRIASRSSGLPGSGAKVPPAEP